MGARAIQSAAQAATCYFRTSTSGDARKALVQIHEPCNLHCAHCFVSATRHGATMPYDAIVSTVIPRLAEARVERVTLTGGEPTMHERFLDVVAAFRDAGMKVGVCTNATLLTPGDIAELARLGAHVNVSLDGFAAESHGKFRGDRGSFDVTVATVRQLAEAGILQGLLCTPNTLAEDDEYRQLCEFARDRGARYVLLNPLSSMGRGVKAQGKLRSPEEHMRQIWELTAPYDGDEFEVVHIRFPNDERRPLSGCEAAKIIYVFTGGEVTVCPYLVFAARTPQSRHDPAEFVVGNILTHSDLAARLDAYSVLQRLPMASTPSCGSCTLAGGCGKGCPAAVVSAGHRIGAAVDELCPVQAGPRRTLPLMPI